MAGSASSQLRSAIIAEVTPGTTPATPAFQTLHRPLLVSAAADPIFVRSLPARGARVGHGVSGIDVTGSLESPLIYGAYDSLLETLMQGAWATNVLKDGKTQATVTVENTIPAGIGGTSTMLRYRGVEATGGKIALAAREEAKISFTVAGRGSDAGTTTIITGATYVDPTELDPLSSGTDVGTITMAGYTLDCMQSAEIDFAFEGRDLQPRLASNDLCGIGRGDFMPTISAKFYIEANFMAIYNASRARQTPFAVTIPIGSITGKKYTIVFPKCVFGPVEPDFSGGNAMQTVQILPEYDTTSAAVVTVTRAVA